MGLLSSLKSRFFLPELCRVAKTGDAVAIVECLACTQIVVIAANLGDAVPFDPDPQRAISMVQAAAEKKTFDGSVHKFEMDGDTLLPIFTDIAAAETFCGAYCGLLGHIHAFRLFTVPGAYILHWIDDHDFIVINPQSHNEVEIDCSKSSSIREGLSDTGSFNEAQFTSLVIPGR